MMKLLTGEKGFTLVELIAVMVILSVLAAVAIPRYMSLDESARQRAIEAGISELNGRETLIWSNIKITRSGYTDDATLFPILDTTLGGDYSWIGGSPAKDGGTLRFQTSVTASLKRTESSDIRPGYWEK